MGKHSDDCTVLEVMIKTSSLGQHVHSILKLLSQCIFQ